VSWSEAEKLEGVRKFGEDADRQKYLIMWMSRLSTLANLLY
jgi:hypothetical protein